jgi:hypothetical protein
MVTALVIVLCHRYGCQDTLAHMISGYLMLIVRFRSVIVFA